MYVGSYGARKGTFFWLCVAFFCLSLVALTTAQDIAPLEIYKTVDIDSAAPGDTLAYTVGLTFPGAPGTWIANLFDNLPPLVDVIPGSITGNGTYDATYHLIRWQVIGSGQADTVEVSCRVIVDPAYSGGTTAVINRAFIPGGFGLEDSAMTMIVVPEPPAMTITKQVDSAEAYAGDTLTYSIQVTNNTPGGMMPISIFDAIPDLTAYVPGSATNGGIYDPVDNSLSWDFSGVNPGMLVDLTFRVVISPNAPDSSEIRNFALITAPDTLLSDTVITLVLPTSPPIEPVLSLDKSVDSIKAIAGDTLGYSIHVANDGNDIADDIAITDSLPDYLTIIPASINLGGTYDALSGAITWPPLNIEPGSDRTLLFDAVIDNNAPDSTYIINYGWLNSPDTTLWDTVSTLVVPDTSGNRPELSFEKTVDKAKTLIGDTLAYTIHMENNGPAFASGVVTTDTIPAYLTVIPASITISGTYDAINRVITWPVFNIEPGSFRTVEFSAVIDSDAPDSSYITNYGYIDSPDSTLWDSATTYIVKDTTTYFVTLVLDKSVDKTRAENGDTLQYTVKIDNNGNTFADGVDVVDSIPDYLTVLTQSITMGGSYHADNRVITWPEYNIEPGADRTLRFDAEINGDAPDSTYITNFVYLDSPDTTLWDSTATFATTGTSENHAVLSIFKGITDAKAIAGDTVDYSIFVKNNGMVSAQDVVVTDTLPSYLTAIASSINLNGVYDANANTITWPPFNLPPTMNQTVVFLAEIKDDTPDSIYVTNYAFAASPDTAIWDSAFVFIEADTSQPQLDISKAVDSVEAAAGSALHYTLTVQNNGEELVEWIGVRDSIPQFCHYIENSASNGGIYNESLGQINWTIASLAPDASTTLTFDVRIDISTPDESQVINRGIIFDPVSDTSNAVTTIVRGKTGDNDLIINKQVDVTSAQPDDIITYTLTVSNTGLDATSAVEVIDTIPDGSQYVAGSVTAGGVFNAGNNSLSWSLGSLAGLENRQLEFQVRVASDIADSSLITNLGHITAPNPLPSNLVTTIVAIPQTPTIALTKVASMETATIGDHISYRITAINNGDGILYDAEVIDNIPDGFELDTLSVRVNGTSAMAVGDDPITIPVGEIAIDATITTTYDLIVTADADLAAEHTNSAILNGSNNIGDAFSFGPVSATVTLDSPQLVVTKTAGAASGSLGSMIKYAVTIENTSSVVAYNVTLTDDMPQGFGYIAGSTLINGIPSANPAGPNPYVWDIGSIQPGVTVKLNYMVQIGADAPAGIAENAVFAEAVLGSETVHSNTARARVNVISPNIPGTIRGRVMIDCDGDGIADGPVAPAGIDIYLDDGSMSRTNDSGMFYFGTVRAGERVVAIDERDLNGYFISEGMQKSVFVHVHESGESYVTFSICPDLPRLSVDKHIAQVPQMRVMKSARLNKDLMTDTAGVFIDYEVSIRSNGGVHKIPVTIVDSLPEQTQIIMHSPSNIELVQSKDLLSFEVVIDEEPVTHSVFYSLEDLAPGLRRFLTNKVHLEANLDPLSEAPTERYVSEPAEVPVGPFKRFPPEDIQIDVVGALFVTSKAYLQPPAFPILAALADSIKKYDGAEVRVEGHADYRRIHTREFPSNWELSTARAKSVFDWFVDSAGIDPNRMTYEGFAATRPVDTGKTMAALQRNRRVEVILKARTEGGVDLSGIVVDQWQAATTLTFDPVNWDTIATGDGRTIDELNDSWEVRIVVGNSGPSEARQAVIEDVLPTGVTLIEGSIIRDGSAVDGITPVNGVLRIPLGDLPVGANREIHYRLKATSAQRPTGKGRATVKAKTDTGKGFDKISNSIELK